MNKICLYARHEGTWDKASGDYGIKMSQSDSRLVNAPSPNEEEQFGSLWKEFKKILFMPTIEIWFLDFPTPSAPCVL